MRSQAGGVRGDHAPPVGRDLGGPALVVAALDGASRNRASRLSPGRTTTTVGAMWHGRRDDGGRASGIGRVSVAAPRSSRRARRRVAGLEESTGSRPRPAAMPARPIDAPRPTTGRDRRPSERGGRERRRARADTPPGRHDPPGQGEHGCDQATTTERETGKPRDERRPGLRCRPCTSQRPDGARGTRSRRPVRVGGARRRPRSRPRGAR